MDKTKHEEEISFKNFFTPLTTAKAIFWIVIIGFVVYINSLFNGFVWDDIGQVVDNPTIRQISNIPSIYFGGMDISGHVMKIHAAFYRPLMETLFTFVYSLFGPTAFFFHFVSLLMHVSISLLVFFLFKRFFKQTLAFLLTAILLIHPFNSEAVDYISAYNDLMYLLFGMICLLLITKKSLSLKRLFVISVSLFLSFLSKEPGFLFVPILIAYTYFYNKKSVLRIIIASVIVITVYILLRTSLYTGLPEIQAFGFSPFLHMSFLSHLANVPKIFTYYLFNFVYPNNLAIAQQWSVQSLTFTDFYLPLVALLFFIGGDLFLIIKTFMKKEKDQVISAIFFSLWFWLGIGLYLEFIPLDMTVADRWFYFPMIGLLGLLGLLFQQFRIRKNFKPLVLGVVIFCLALLAIRTMVRNANWQSERSLYFHDISINHDSFDLTNLVGMIYFKDHNLNMASLYFKKSISLYQCSDAVNNLGYLEQTLGDKVYAEKAYYTAVHCSHGYKDYGNLVILLYNEHKYDLCEKYTKEAIQKFPNGPGLYFVLGLAQYQKGDKEDALKNLAIGYKLSNDPQIANAYLLMEQNKPIDFPL